MAHFAELDSNNIVQRVLVVNNSDIIDNNGEESEQIGVLFLQKLFGNDTIWKQTSYNNKFRHKYGAIGYTYREDLDAFISPSPYPSWIFNQTTLEWDPPIPKPDDFNDGNTVTAYFWNETDQKWDSITENINQ